MKIHLTCLLRLLPPKRLAVYCLIKLLCLSLSKNVHLSIQLFQAGWMDALISHHFSFRIPTALSMSYISPTLPPLSVLRSFLTAIFLVPFLPPSFTHLLCLSAVMTGMQAEGEESCWVKQRRTTRPTQLPQGMCVCVCLCMSVSVHQCVYVCKFMTE